MSISELMVFHLVTKKFSMLCGNLLYFLDEIHTDFLVYYVLYICVLCLVELAQNTGLLANSAAALGSVEEHTSLSRVLSQLAEVEDKIDLLHVNQADSDYYILSEFVKDYVGLIQAVKVCQNKSVDITIGA